MTKPLALLSLLIISACADSSSSENQKESHVYSQKELVEIMKPVFESDGKVYKKVKKVFAKKATAGEAVQTITDDGLETTNTAKEGDFIIKNQTEAGERYIVPGEKFDKLYDFSEEGPEGYSVYSAKGKIIGVEVNDALIESLNLDEEFYFIAKWNEKMIVKKGDYLASPLDYSEVYRIARKEFFETYKPDE